MKELETIDAETLLYNPLKEIEFIVDEILPKIVMSMDGLYPDSYPANIFKNVKKCKEIEAKVNSKIT